MPSRLEPWADPRLLTIPAPVTEPGTPRAWPLRAAQGLLAAFGGLLLVLATVVVGVAPAAANGFAPPPTAATYTYDGAAPVAHGTSWRLLPAALLPGPAREGSRPAEGVSTRLPGFGVAAETAEVAAGGARQVTVLGRCTGGVGAYVGKPGFNTLNLPFKGAGRWNWTRNKSFIDDAIERGDEIRLVTNPNEPLYQGGNTFQRELRYLQDRGYTWQEQGDYWNAVPR